MKPAPHGFSLYSASLINVETPSSSLMQDQNKSVRHAAVKSALEGAGRCADTARRRLPADDNRAVWRDRDSIAHVRAVLPGVGRIGQARRPGFSRIQLADKNVDAAA